MDVRGIHGLLDCIDDESFDLLNHGCPEVRQVARLLHMQVAHFRTAMNSSRPSLEVIAQAAIAIEKARGMLAELASYEDE